jgi:membrane protease subunit HflC
MRTPIISGIVLVVLYLAYTSLFVVTEREQALVLRFGEITRQINEPGIYFKLPSSVIDTVQKIEDRVLRFDLDDIRVQVADGKFYDVDAFVAYKVSNPTVFRTTVSANLISAEQRLRTRLNDALRGAYGKRGFEAALSAERAEMMLEVRDQLRPQATSLGMQIVDVRIRRTDLTQQVSQQTYARMSAERLAEAERLRANGQEKALTIRAKAEREAVELVASAQRDSEILRGEGEGESTKLFASAYQRDPEFFEFYRSMIAYRTALEGNSTTMVLSPDTDFFRYFANPLGDEKSKAGGPLAAPAPAAQ